VPDPRVGRGLSLGSKIGRPFRRYHGGFHVTIPEPDTVWLPYPLELSSRGGLSFRLCAVGRAHLRAGLSYLGSGTGG